MVSWNGQATDQCTGGTYGCPRIQWPGNNVNVDGEQPADPAPTWFGGLLDQHADGSGLQYMRNRYYDPKTGRFTQQDPIGLAGGMNITKGSHNVFRALGFSAVEAEHLRVPAELMLALERLIARRRP